MPHSFYRILTLLVLVPEALAFSVGVLRYRQFLPPMKHLVVLVAFGFLVNVMVQILYYYEISHQGLIAVSVPVEFFLIGQIYRYELQNTRLRKGMPLLIGTFLAFALCMRLVEGWLNFNPVERFVEGVLILWFVLLYFYQTLKNLSTRYLERSPLFWLSAGLFIYFPSDIIIFIFSDLILSSYSQRFYQQLWAVHSMLSILLYFFYTLALWVNQKK